MKAALPASTAPSGAPRPLVKSIQTESKEAAMSLAAMPEATQAFMQARAVHVRGPALAARHRRHLVELRQRPDRAAADVGGLLHLQQPLRRRIARARPDGGAHVVGREVPARARQRQDLHAREGRMRAAFAGEDVARLVRDHLLARRGSG